MSEVVLDASAVLALLRDEPGADIVAGHMPRSGPAANDPVWTALRWQGYFCAALAGRGAVSVR